MGHGGWALVIAGLVLVGSFGIGAELARSSPGGPSASPLVTDIAPVPPGARTADVPGPVPVALTLSLEGRDPAGLAVFLAAVEDPASPEYGHYLTAAEFEAEFAAPETTADAVASALVSAGGSDVAIASDRLAVSAVLPAASVDALFGVTLVSFESSDGRAVYTAVGTPQLPAALAGLVTGIGGLSDAASEALSYNLVPGEPLQLAHAGGDPAYIQGNTSGAQWFIGSDYASVLGATELFPGSGVLGATYPTHVAIATLLASGWNQTQNIDLPPWDPVAVNWYLNYTLGPSWPHSNLTGVPVTYDGITPPVPGPNNGLNDSSLDQIENSLDLEMAASIAPGAPLYNFYISGGLLNNLPTYGDIADALASALSDALTYSYGSARLGAISGSFGLPDLNDSAWNAGLQMAAAMGVTVVVASGDQGNAPNGLTGRPDGQWPTWPASASFNSSGAIAVGGLTINVSGLPAGWYNDSGFVIEYDANITGLNSAVTWYDTTGGPGNIAGSEGGLSEVFAEPYWQYHSAAQPPIAAAAGVQGIGSLQRAEPDVALPANYTIVATGENATGAIYGYLLEGTSIAAPSFAGLVADEVAVRSGNSIAPTSWAPLGFLDPTLYRIGSYYAAHPNATGAAYLDITKGSNYVFSAGVGWDATTGWGMPLAEPLLRALATPAIANFTYTGPTPGVPTSSAPQIPWLDIYLIFGVGLAAAVVLVLVMARPRRPKTTGVPWGAHLGNAPTEAPALAAAPYPGATFQCPYCGAIRPAEPVRCPTCGAL